MSTALQITPSQRPDFVSSDEERVARLKHSLAQLSIENARLRELAHADVLTQLGNRRRFEQALNDSVTHAYRYGHVVSLLMADLDGMKRLNDTQGHPAGDEMLRRTAKVLRACTRSCDVVTRLGGDEFAIIMPSTGTHGAAKVAERIRAEIEKVSIGGETMSVSVGIAQLEAKPDVESAVADLVCRADRTLYSAKRTGKNNVAIHPSTVVRALRPSTGQGVPMNKDHRPPLRQIRNELRRCMYSGETERAETLLQQLKDSADNATTLVAGELRDEYVRWKTRFELLTAMEQKAA